MILLIFLLDFSQTSGIVDALLLPVWKMANLEGRLVRRLFQKIEDVKLEFVMSFEERMWVKVGIKNKCE